MPRTAGATPNTVVAEEEQRTKQTEAQEQEGGQLLHMHTAHPGVPIPYLTPQDVKANVRVVTSRLPSVPTRDLAFYGGLGALAVAGALEWPIALAVGGATAVVRARVKEAEERRQSRAEPAEPKESGSSRKARQEEKKTDET